MIVEVKGIIQCTFAKDLKFRFASCSDLLAEMAGCDSSQQIVGKDDYQLAWRRDADFFREKDTAIIKGGQCYSQLETIQTKGSDPSELQETQIIITKAPLFDNEGNCIGLCGSLIDVTELRIYPKLGEFDKHGRLCLGSRWGNEYLTQAECLVLKEILVTGERAVARKLGLSRSSVSTHVMHIRKKLQCTSVVELRKMIIERGLVHELFSKNIIEQYVTQKLAKEADFNLQASSIEGGKSQSNIK